MDSKVSTSVKLNKYDYVKWIKYRVEISRGCYRFWVIGLISTTHPPPYLLPLLLLVVLVHVRPKTKSVHCNVRDQGSGYDPGTCHRLAGYCAMLCFLSSALSLYKYTSGNSRRSETCHSFI